jgi:hypothetical protein
MKDTFEATAIQWLTRECSSSRTEITMIRCGVDFIREIADIVPRVGLAHKERLFLKDGGVVEITRRPYKKDPIYGLRVQFYARDDDFLKVKYWNGETKSYKSAYPGFMTELEKI